MNKNNTKNNIMPVLEMFVSIQGEGKYTGEPSLFIRVSGCNLRCVFGDTRCDTPYSSFETEKPIYKNAIEVAEATKKILESHPHVKHIVITGGEPMLYKNGIREFLEILLKPDREYVITVETNGTLPAIQPWDVDMCDDFAYWMFYIDLWSVSPKLSTSVDKEGKFLDEKWREMHNKTRINIDSLASYVKATQNIILENRYFESNLTSFPILPDFQFKFVYTNEDSVKEIKEVMERVASQLSISMDVLNNHIMLMPEGTNNEHLEKISQECVEVCIREGWRFCDRLHIRLWGDKRGV